ncbi:MAG: hypothetical protein N2691_01895 [Patescibacteria group bacterium]|nr:hypothetical protein [Patescibacteria group bacterium]
MSAPDSNFTHLPPGVAHDSRSPVLSVNEQRKRSRKPLTALSNLVIVLGIVSLIGSLAYAITGRQNTTATRAATDPLVAASVQQVPLSTLELTRGFSTIPVSYKGTPIPSNLAEEGRKLYPDMSEDQRTAYIINRIVLYYLLKDVLDENGIEYRKIEGDVTFAAIENSLPNMKSQFDFNLLHRADYVFLKVYFVAFDNDYRAREKFGPNLQEKALAVISSYRDKLAANPANYQEILDEANADQDVILLTNGEMNIHVRGYFADLNNVPAQDYYIYDEEFDQLLFSLPVNQVSEVLTLNSTSPYMYIVVYPTRIEKKKYLSIKDVIAERMSQFQ